MVGALAGAAAVVASMPADCIKLRLELATSAPPPTTRAAVKQFFGTGAAIAANFAVLGTGSDTGQSIRSPASANNLVGIRPTRGLVSRAGVIPNSLTQDEIGPITRTVVDAALLLDVMAGHDPNDPITAFSRERIPGSYAHLLSKRAPRGARRLRLYLLATRL